MATKKAVTVVSSFTDAAGKVGLTRMQVEKVLSGANLDMTALNTNITAVLDPMEAMSKLKYKASQLIVPITIDAGAFKADPVAGSSVREQGYIVFKSAPGDSGKPTTARVFVPSPKTNKLLSGGTSFDLAAIDTETDTIKTNCLTSDGRDLSAVSGSGVRQY
jgi:hypothetical protein